MHMLCENILEIYHKVLREEATSEEIASLDKHRNQCETCYFTLDWDRDITSALLSAPLEEPRKDIALAVHEQLKKHTVSAIQFFNRIYAAVICTAAFVLFYWYEIWTSALRYMKGWTLNYAQYAVNNVNKFISPVLEVISPKVISSISPAYYAVLFLVFLGGIILIISYLFIPEEPHYSIKQSLK